MMNYEIFKEVVKEKFLVICRRNTKGMEVVTTCWKGKYDSWWVKPQREVKYLSPTIYINDYV